MSSSAKESSSTAPFFLSPIDNILAATYSPKLLLFTTPRGHADSAVLSFRHGLQSTFQAIPLLAGSIKAIPDGTAQANTLAITSPWRTVDEIFKIKDLRKSKKYRYSQLRENGFPSSSLPPWDFLHLGFFMDLNPPAMHVQITLIEGGLVLAPCVHHNFIDGTGTAVILQLWAASCRGETIPNDDISSLWRQVTLLEGNEKVAVEELPDYTYDEKTSFMKKISIIGNDNQRSWLSRWWLVSDMRKQIEKYLKPMLIKLIVLGIIKYQSFVYSNRLIYFSYADLARLKESLQAEGEELDRKTWISTMDTLSSLIFCCVTQSRHEAKHRDFPSSTYASKTKRGTLWDRSTRWLHHIIPTSFLFQSPFQQEASAQFMTYVNVRKHCQLPPNYIRNMFLPCSIRTPLHELLPSIRNLATQARKLRTRLQGFDSAHVGRVASMIRSVPDVSKIDFSAGESQGQALTMSSWREQGFCALDWGSHVGAKCERVRICKYFFDGLVIVFPEYSGSKIDGGIELALALRKDAMRELEKNEFFNQFARWR